MRPAFRFISSDALMGWEASSVATRQRIVIAPESAPATTLRWLFDRTEPDGPKWWIVDC
jgi:hypothetical protein